MDAVLRKREERTNVYYVNIKGKFYYRFYYDEDNSSIVDKDGYGADLFDRRKMEAKDKEDHKIVSEDEMPKEVLSEIDNIHEVL